MLKNTFFNYIFFKAFLHHMRAALVSCHGRVPCVIACHPSPQSWSSSVLLPCCPLITTCLSFSSCSCLLALGTTSDSPLSRVLLKILLWWGIPGGQWLGLSTFSAKGPRFSPLVGELRSRKPCVSLLCRKILLGMLLWSFRIRVIPPPPACHSCLEG